MTKKEKTIRRPWSPRETELVEKLYPIDGPFKLSKKLARSIPAVKQRAYSMGLKRKGHNRYCQWQADELRLLKKEYPNANSIKLAKRIGRPLSAVRQMAYELGLTKKNYRFWTII